MAVITVSHATCADEERESRKFASGREQQAGKVEPGRTLCVRAHKTNQGRGVTARHRFAEVILTQSNVTIGGQPHSELVAMRHLHGQTQPHP